MEISESCGITMSTRLDIYYRDRVLHILCQEGSLSFLFQNTRYHVSRHEYVIITESALASDFVVADDFSGLVLWLRHDFVSAAAIRNNYDIVGRLSLMRNPIMKLTPREYSRCLSDLIRLRERIADTSPIFRDELLAHLLAAHILDLYDIHARQEDQPAVSERYASLLHGFIDLLQNGHYLISRDLKYYAGKLCITAHYLADISREVSGKSAGYWIERFTINEMVRLVADTRMPFTEMAEKMNFKSLSHFSRYFSAKVGVTPTKYRSSLVHK